MRMEVLENLVFTGQIEGKRGREMQRVTYLMSFSKWMVETRVREK